MVKNKRLLLVVSLVLVLNMILAGCSTPNTDGGQTSAPADSTTTTAPAETKDIAYPESGKTIKMIVPAAAGGGTDVIGRQLASLMEKELGVPVIVENKSGGGTLVGLSEVVASKPDGYTIGCATNSLVLSRHTSQNGIPYDKLDYVAMFNDEPGGVLVNAESPYKTMEDFVAAAKAKPENIKAANAGTNGIWHLVSQQVEQAIGAKFKHVPYDGAATAFTAVAGGHVDVAFMSPTDAKALLSANKLKLLAIIGDNRDTKMFPDVPTAKELGYEVSTSIWRGVVVPKGTDPAIIAKLESVIEKCMASDEFKSFMEKGGFTTRYMNAENFEAVVAKEDAFYEKAFNTAAK